MDIFSVRCVGVCVSVRTGNPWLLRIRIRPSSLEPLIFGFLILAGRFGFAIYFGRRPDVKLPFP